MKKTSIFSRDYGRRMRKRRRRIATISALGVIVILFIVIKISMNNINIDTYKNKVQAWIDGDNAIENEASGDKALEGEDTNNIADNEIVEEPPKEPEVKTMDFKVNDNATLKVEYEEVDGKSKFKEVKEVPTNIYYSINNSKNLILTIDEQQNMKIFNVDKKESNITKNEYIAPNGEVFNKDTILQTYNGYLWNVEAKFISDTKIAYISNVPYFGYDLNKYIWVADLNNNSHITLWNSKGKEIKFGDIKEKGLEVTIDGNVKYININGELIS